MLKNRGHDAFKFRRVGRGVDCASVSGGTMSKFTTPAILEMLDDYKWRLVERFAYYTELPHSRLRAEIVGDADQMRIGFFIDVPAGYETDLASVPRCLWMIFPPHGRYAKAAIVHDYLYSQAIGTKAFADNVFNEAMVVLGVPKWRRLTMYWAVRCFGRGGY